MLNAANSKASLHRKEHGKHSGRRGRRIISVLLIIVLSGLLFGCNLQGPPSQEDPSTVRSSGKAVKSPTTFYYTTKNPLEIIETTQDEDSEHRFSYTSLEISGLKNKEVEGIINEKLTAAYAEIEKRDLPPYRGIKVKIPEGSQVIGENIYMTVAGNFNNIFSVQLEKHTRYAIPNAMGEILKTRDDFYENSEMIYETNVLNLDLNTGEEITLDKVFCDDTPYLELLSDRVKTILDTGLATEEGYYFMMNSWLKLVAPFKGFAEDPTFAIYPYGIGLFFDEKTPEFDTGLSPSFLSLNYGDFQGHIAVSERYFDEGENIYERDEPPVKSLLASQYLEGGGGGDYFMEDRTSVSLNWRYPKSMPEKIQKLVESYATPDSQVIADLNERMATGEGSGASPDMTAYYGVDVMADTIANYINFSNYRNKSIMSYYEMFAEFKCFDKASLEELTFDDIFVDGFDYKSIVLETIEKNFKDSRDNNGQPLSLTLGPAELEAIYSTVTGFNLSTDALQFYASLPDGSYSAYNMISYEEFGCDNMTIFD